MVIFILLFILMLNKTHQDLVKSTAQTKSNLVASLKEKAIDAQLDETDPLSVIFNMAEDKIKFKYNDYQLPPESAAFLNAFIPEFAQTVCQGEMANKIQSVQIIGHTDSVADDEYNLQLSQQRALSVMKYIINHTDLKHTDKDCLFNLISINGRGERELLPKSSLPGKEDRAKSRRVEFRIRIKSYEEQKML